MTTLMTNSERIVDAKVSEPKKKVRRRRKKSSAPEGKGFDPDSPESQVVYGHTLITPSEPEDYIVPQWARFCLDYWFKMDDTPLVKISGFPGTGKTQFVMVLAYRTGRRLLMVNAHPEMTYESLLGQWVLHQGEMRWLPGPIVLAAQYNCLLCIDEITLMGTAAQAGLNPLTDAVQKGVYISAIGKRVDWPDPRVLILCNEGLLGTREMPQALQDRAECLEADYLPAEDEIKLMMNRTGIDQPNAANAVKCAGAIRAAAAGEKGAVPLDFHLTPRRLMAWARQVVAGRGKHVAWQQSVVNAVGCTPERSRARGVVATLSKSHGFNVVVNQ